MSNQERNEFPAKDNSERDIYSSLSSEKEIQRGLSGIKDILTWESKTMTLHIQKKTKQKKTYSLCGVHLPFNSFLFKP